MATCTNPFVKADSLGYRSHRPPRFGRLRVSVSGDYSLSVQEIRHDWTVDEVLGLFERPLNDLLFEAQATHRRRHPANEVQISTLLSIKTGGCPEDCKYCPQSVHYDTGVDTHNVLPVEDVVTAAGRARAAGATRFCMGAAWRAPTNSQTHRVSELVRAVKATGMETCVTLGMLTDEQAAELADAGLDYYNHNLDTSPEYYGEIITTRNYQDRLDTLAHVRAAGVKVCCGGIVGMGESRTDRAGLLAQLANLPEHPESVPINNLVQVEGTPLYGTDTLSPLELVRCVAVARILMPGSVIRLSAGRTEFERGGPGALLPGRRGFHLLRRPAADDAESRVQRRHGDVRGPRTGRPAAPVARAMRFFDDIPDDYRSVVGTWTLTDDAIVDFAGHWDPQPFHTDAAAAAASVFGGLVASSAHLFAICTRLFFDHEDRIQVVAMLGKDKLRLPSPARAGDHAHV